MFKNVFEFSFQKIPENTWRSTKENERIQIRIVDTYHVVTVKIEAKLR